MGVFNELAIMALLTFILVVFAAVNLIDHSIILTIAAVIIIPFLMTILYINDKEGNKK